MLEKPPEQIDFFRQLDKTADTIASEVEIETAPEPKTTKQAKKKRSCQNKFNPPSGRLGGWASRYDGNLNDPNLEKRWKN